ncbi:MAG: NfeD family protein [Bacteroidota bacterium]
MELFAVIGLIALGMILLIVEIIFIPGTTVVGIAGFLCSIYGVYLGYDYFGTTGGTLVLAGAAIFNLGAIIYAFKSKSWERFSLKDVNSGKFNEEFRFQLNIGDHGTTISSLKPIGKAIFNDHEMEVRSEGTYITENQEIEIIKIDNNKIIVKSITT